MKGCGHAILCVCGMLAHVYQFCMCVGTCGGYMHVAENVPVFAHEYRG